MKTEVEYYKDIASKAIWRLSDYFTKGLRDKGMSEDEADKECDLIIIENLGLYHYQLGGLMYNEGDSYKEYCAMQAENGEYAVSEAEYYEGVAEDAICALEPIYFAEECSKGNDEETADDIVMDRLIEDLDLSPYQLTDFFMHEYEPYDDYCAYCNN